MHVRIRDAISRSHLWMGLDLSLQTQVGENFPKLSFLFYVSPSFPSWVPILQGRQEVHPGLPSPFLSRCLRIRNLHCAETSGPQVVWTSRCSLCQSQDLNSGLTPKFIPFCYPSLYLWGVWFEQSRISNLHQVETGSAAFSWHPSTGTLFPGPAEHLWKLQLHFSLHVSKHNTILYVSFTIQLFFFTDESIHLSYLGPPLLITLWSRLSWHIHLQVSKLRPWDFQDLHLLNAKQGYS